MRWAVAIFLLTIAGAVAAAKPAAQPVTLLMVHSEAEVRQAFVAANGVPRIVLFLSPT